MKRVEVVYQVRPNFQGGWNFTPAAQSAPASGGLASA
jgi:hypothetical protein